MLSCWLADKSPHGDHWTPERIGHTHIPGDGACNQGNEAEERGKAGAHI